jgi:hypothetical protein
MENKTKEAGGEILGRVGGLLARPFVGQARSQNINQGIQNFVTSRVNQPIERGLRKARIDKAVGKAVRWGTADIPGTPRLIMKHRPLSERLLLGSRAGEKAVKLISENPEYAMFPDPVSGKVYLGLKHFTRRAIGAQPLTKTAQVDAYQQEKEWTCSAACLRAALLHLGYDLPESDLADVIGAQENRGAETTQIVEAANKLGLESWEQGFDSLQDAIEVLKHGIPIIADIQSFNYPGKGHYVVIAGHRPGKGFVIMDPNTKGKTAIDNWRLVPDEEMEEIWWDRAMAPPHDMMIKWGVMVTDPSNTKEASTQLNGLFDELEKIGNPVAGAISGALLGGALGGYAGHQQGAGKSRLNPELSNKTFLTSVGAISGAVFGAILGAASPLVVSGLRGSSREGKEIATGIVRSTAAGTAIGAGAGGALGIADAANLVDDDRTSENAKSRIIGNVIHGALVGSVFGLSHGVAKSVPNYGGSGDPSSYGGYEGYKRRHGVGPDKKEPLPDWLKGVKTKNEAKRRYRDLARKNHPDRGGDTKKMQDITTAWESAQMHSDFPKTASIFFEALLSELEKIGASREAIEAMKAGGKAMGIFGGVYGAAKGMTPDEEGKKKPISKAVKGTIAGGLIGALLALGIQRRASGKPAIPNIFSKNASSI